MFVTDQQRKTALGPLTTVSDRQYYTKMIELFKPMAKPQSGDWLYSHKQVHQAYSNYKLPYYNQVTPQRNIIYLQPFDKFQQSFIEQLIKFCSVFYPKMIVKCAKPLNFETQLGNIKKRKNVYGNQYLAQDILAYMQKVVPKDAYCVMGITLQDIYPGDSWNFVYGWAKYKARVGIFSFIRWDDQYASGNTKQIDWNLILYPSIRTMVHEIGHMFGITHCVYYRCLMNGFNHIQQNYLNPLQFCPICFRKIYKNIGFDIQQRYSNLIKYCEQSTQKKTKKDLQLYIELIKISKNIKIQKQKPNTLIQPINNNKPAINRKKIGKSVNVISRNYNNLK